MRIGGQWSGDGAAVSRPFTKDLAALEDLFSFVGAFVAEHGIDARDAFAVQLVVEELFTNAVRHGGPGREVTVTLQRRGDRVHMEVVDAHARPFDPAAVPGVDPRAPAEDRRPGGLGLHLVRELADSSSFEFSDGRLTVTAVRTLERSDV